MLRRIVGSRTVQPSWKRSIAITSNQKLRNDIKSLGITLGEAIKADDKNVFEAVERLRLLGREVRASLPIQIFLIRIQLIASFPPFSGACLTATRGSLMRWLKRLSTTMQKNSAMLERPSVIFYPYRILPRITIV